MKRYGSVIKVKPEFLDAYKKYHAAVWPEVLAMIRQCNIRNYSIYLKDDFLFGYFEYHGAYYAGHAMQIIDTPQHLWDLDLFHYSWLDSLPELNRSFRMPDYLAAAEGL